MDAALAPSALAPGQAKLGPVKEERVDTIQGCYNQPHVARPSRLEEKGYSSCGLEHRIPGVCPAKGKNCSKCDKPNDFAKVFRGRWPRSHVGPEGGNKASYARRWHWDGGRIPRQQTLPG
ncbi:hypothetical protein NDU88_000294 [Pleurodeles waltl]|uniref:Uncharacterized protein n=1 Tax=Pleurodeles waltl TaxID=8319 RepID=A0AAV7WHS9_PLEWA|nr:hypothetical protein NDU88_000294 [Pleurodeles waltl]